MCTPNILAMCDQMTKIKISLTLLGRRKYKLHTMPYNNYIDRIIWKPITVSAILQKCDT